MSQDDVAPVTADDDLADEDDVAEEYDELDNDLVDVGKFNAPDREDVDAEAGRASDRDLDR